MSKISVIGICGMSIFMNVDHFHQKGETLIADGLFYEIGGKGINQAIAAARMGAEVSFLTAIGDDSNGAECEKVIKENNIKGLVAKKTGKKTAIAYILTDKTGENQVTEYQEAFLNQDDVYSFESEIAKSEILLLQQEVPPEVNKAAIKIANKYGVKIILNPAPPREIDDKTAKSVYMVTPNKQESKFIDVSRFANCVTTLGDEGCSVNDKIFIKGMKVKAVDTTGAGDTFNGVLAACLADGLPMEISAKYAVRASGISITRANVLNAIPYREEVLEKE